MIHKTNPSYYYYLEMLDLIKNLNIDKNDICLIGDFAFFKIGMTIRDNSDINLCMRASARDMLIEKGTCLSQNIKVIKNGYLELIGVSDEEIISNDMLHVCIDGFKIIRPEIEFAAKTIRMSREDQIKIPIIEKYALQTDEWDWGLVFDPVERDTFFYSNIKKLLKRNGIHILFNKVLMLIRMILKKMKKQVQKKVIAFSLLKLLDTEILIKYPTEKLLARQYLNDNFNRMDVIVRYLAAENYINEAESSFQLYNKMQDARGTRKNSEVIFKKLINSVIENGIDSHSEITIDKFGNLIDGAHRLALSLYYNAPEISVKIQPSRFRTRYDIDWFKLNQFSCEEIKYIENKRHEIFRQKGLYFYIILWPPIQEYFNSIEGDLNEEFTIIDSKQYEFFEDQFNDIVRKIYAIDDIDKWKIEKKLYHMKVYEKKVRFIELEITNPRYRKKVLNNHDISQTVEDVKAKYRQKYKRHIDNYVYDIIIHAGDNYKHNREIYKIFNNNQ